MTKKIRSFEDLECWKACREVRLFIQSLIKNFPEEEKFALTDGMRRASYSITENIAEGYGRYHFQENIQFCRQSRGSLYEIKDQLISAHDNNYISEEDQAKGQKLIMIALALLNGYINYLNKAKSRNQKPDENITAEDIEEYNI
jgi:four helix bundle protein